MVTTLEAMKPILENIELSIIIPVFNEQENVIPLFDSIHGTLEKMGCTFEIIFIDDGSTDNTFDNLRLLVEEYREEKILRILQLQRNFGQTQALCAGFQNAKGKYVISLDGDLQNDPEDIPKMISALTDDLDVVCGWRKYRQDSILKKIPSKINNFLNRKLNKVNIHDSGCTLRIYRREAVENLQLFAEGHRFIPAILAHQGYRIGEIVSKHHPRVQGKSKYGIKRLFRGIVDLYTLYLLNKWQHKPSHFFVRWAGVLSFLGVVSILWVLSEQFFFHLFWRNSSESKLFLQNPLFFLSLLLFFFSMQTLFFGFLAEIFVKNNTQKKQLFKIRNEWN